MPRFLDTVIQHADQQVWVPYFDNLRLREPAVDVVMVGSGNYPVFASKCDLNNDNRPGDIAFPTSQNAWYCGADGGTWRGALILPLTTLKNMWSGQILQKVSERPGDLAAATVVAHEFGHHVADELAQQTGIQQPLGKGPELLADCLAGVWAYAAGADGYLEPGDLEEGIAAMAALGLNGSSTHGTAQERTQAFMVGWNAQRYPYHCMTNYWPGMANWLQG